MDAGKEKKEGRREGMRVKDSIDREGREKGREN